MTIQRAEGDPIHDPIARTVTITTTIVETISEAQFAKRNTTLQSAARADDAVAATWAQIASQLPAQAQAQLSVTPTPS